MDLKLIAKKRRPLFRLTQGFKSRFFLKVKRLSPERHEYDVYDKQGNLVSFDIEFEWKGSTINVISFFPEVDNHVDYQNGDSAACFHLILAHFMQAIDLKPGVAISIDAESEVIKSFYSTFLGFDFSISKSIRFGDTIDGTVPEFLFKPADVEDLH